jgi:hypothetical protein
MDRPQRRSRAVWLNKPPMPAPDTTSHLVAFRPRPVCHDDHVVPVLLVLVVVLAFAAAALGLADVVRDRDPGWGTSGLLAATELVALVQLVVGLVKLTGTDRAISGPAFTAYLVLGVLIPPVAFVWAATERTRWGSAVLVVGALAVVALEFRLDQVWGG